MHQSSTGAVFLWWTLNDDEPDDDDGDMIQNSCGRRRHRSQIGRAMAFEPPTWRLPRAIAGDGMVTDEEIFSLGTALFAVDLDRDWEGSKRENKHTYCFINLWLASSKVLTIKVVIRPCRGRWGKAMAHDIFLRRRDRLPHFTWFSGTHERRWTHD